MSNEKIVKAIAQAQEAIKKKYQSLKQQNNQAETAFIKAYKPLIKPLQEVARNTKRSREPDLIEFKEPPTSNLLDFEADEEEKKFVNDTKTVKRLKPAENTYDDYANDDDDVEDDNIYYDNLDGGGGNEADESFKDAADFSMTEEKNYELDNKKNKELITSPSKACQKDDIFGPRKVGSEHFIGSKLFSFDTNNNIIHIGDRTYALTKGLNQLIFFKKPNLSLINKLDKNNYKAILEYTNVHQSDFSSSGKNRSIRSTKFKQIIGPLTTVAAAAAAIKNSPSPRKNKINKVKTDKSKIGGNLISNNNFSSKVYTDKPVEYIYFDDTNEIVERLQLLVSEKFAGHSGHDNEISSIIEELRESGVIINRAVPSNHNSF